MPKIKKISGKEVISIFKKFGFEVFNPEEREMFHKKINPYYAGKTV